MRPQSLDMTLLDLGEQNRVLEAEIYALRYRQRMLCKYWGVDSTEYKEYKENIFNLTEKRKKICNELDQQIKKKQTMILSIAKNRKIATNVETLLQVQIPSKENYKRPAKRKIVKQ